MENTPHITLENQAQADDIRAREKALRDWMGKRNSYHRNELPPHINPPSNAERSALELWEFNANPPAAYFAYVYPERLEVGTWTGQRLGRLTLGTPYRDNFGGTRVPVWMDGGPGKMYAGTWYKSAGDYCRLRKVRG